MIFIKNCGFSHVFELGEYIGEETVVWEVIKFDEVIDIIEEYCTMEAGNEDKPM